MGKLDKLTSWQTMRARLITSSRICGEELQMHRVPHTYVKE